MNNDPNKNKWLREEYTRLRSAAMKRVKRARSAGLGNMPNIMGAEYLLPRLRDVDTTDNELLGLLVAEVRSFLARPTKLSELRAELAEGIVALRAVPIFRAFTDRDAEAFYEFSLYASAELQDKLRYLLNNHYVGITSVRGQEVYDYVSSEFDQWYTLYKKKAK